MENFLCFYPQSLLVMVIHVSDYYCDIKGYNS